MTTNEYTPTAEESISAFLLHAVTELAATSTISYREAVEVLYRLAELDAAAEKRGAANALREAADEIRHRQHAESVRQMLHARADEMEKEDGDG